MVWIKQKSCSNSQHAASLHMPSCFGTVVIVNKYQHTHLREVTVSCDKVKAVVISPVSHRKCLRLVVSAPSCPGKGQLIGCWKPPGAPRGGGADQASNTLRRDPLSTCCENCLSQTVSPTFQIRLGIMSHKSFCHLSAPVVSLPLWHNDHCVLLICCHKPGGTEHTCVSWAKSNRYPSGFAIREQEARDIKQPAQGHAALSAPTCPGLCSILLLHAWLLSTFPLASPCWKVPLMWAPSWTSKS